MKVQEVKPKGKLSLKAAHNIHEAVFSSLLLLSIWKRLQFDTPSQRCYFGWLDVVVGGLNAASGYTVVRDMFLTAGDNPVVQNAMDDRQNDTADRPVDERAVELVNDVLTSLIKKGDYVLRNNSLPFRAKVTANEAFNANCDFSNFICVFDGAVKACGYSRDEVAALLGHEMTHGYDQHIANSQAKHILSGFINDMAGQALANSNLGVGAVLSDDWLNFLAVKNIDLPNEKAADRNGFYVMASAGFNPGGAAALMARMSYYPEHRSQFEDFFRPDEHPDTRNRLKDMAALLTTYGLGHTEVKNVNDVYFDNHLLLIAEPSGAQDAEEMAYLISGGIAKGFHDHRLFADWNFRTTTDGKVDFLDDNPVYKPLKDALNNELGLGEHFRSLVERAYNNDSKNGAREKFLKEEMDRKRKNEEFRQKLAAQKQDSPDKALNGTTYMKLGLTDLAEKEFLRSGKLDAQNPAAKSGMATVLSKRGDFDGALRLANEAIAMNPNLGSSYVSRALVYKDQGDMDSALSDCNQALKAGQKDSYAYKVAGDIFSAQGATESALIEYKAYHEAVPKAMDIPAEYMARLK